MEELFRLVRDENDIDKALSMICSGYILEPSYKSEYNCSLLFHAVYSEKPGIGKNTGRTRRNQAVSFRIAMNYYIKSY